MYLLVGVLAVVVATEGWLLWRVTIAMRVVEDVTTELARVNRGLQLLTETAETGFATFAGVLSHSLQPASVGPMVSATVGAPAVKTPRSTVRPRAGVVDVAGSKTVRPTAQKKPRASAPVPDKVTLPDSSIGEDV